MAFLPGASAPPPEEPNPNTEPARSAPAYADDVLPYEFWAGEPVYDGWAPPPTSRGGRRRAIKLVIELTQTLIIAALIFLLVRTMAQNFRVEGSSMEPGLHNGQYLLVNKALYFRPDLGPLADYVPFLGGQDGTNYLFRGPRRGDVIVFRYPRDPSRDFIKRVIGVPGDRVNIDNGKVYVNDQPLTEPYIPPVVHGSLMMQTVPPGQYFVLGDNRDNSSDSRSWGFVPEENIIGQALFSYWPLETLGGVGNHHIDLGLIKLPLP